MFEIWIILCYYFEDRVHDSFCVLYIEHFVKPYRNLDIFDGFKKKLCMKILQLLTQ